MPQEIELIPRCKGYIFDMDGTIIDSMKVHLRVWQQILENYGIHRNIKQVEAQSDGINPEIVRRFFGKVYKGLYRTQNGHIRAIAPKHNDL